MLVKHSAIALEEVCQCWGALGLKAAEINVPAAELPLRAALGQGCLQGHSSPSCWAGAAPQCEHTALGHQAWPSHRNKPQEPYNQYNLNANLSNYTRLQREIRAQTNQLAAQTAADMQVWGVFCPCEDQMLHTDGGSESSAVHPSEVKNYGINSSGMDVPKV